MESIMTFVDRHGQSHELSDPGKIDEELAQIAAELQPLRAALIRSDEHGSEAAELAARSLLDRTDELEKYSEAWNAIARKSVIAAIDAVIAAYAGVVES